MLEVKNLFFRHKGQKKDILQGISFSVKKGIITSILGPNGSGKSTLFKCIAGIWKPYKGEINVNGVSTNELSFSQKAKLFSFVPQEHEPPFPYSVFDMVLMGRINYIGMFSQPAKRDYQIVEDVLKDMGIYHLKEIPYTKISGGERQLVLIARAISQQAPVMLLDEPTSHLDFRNQIMVLSKIKEVAKERALSVVITLHDPNLASVFSDDIVVIKDGKLIKSGPSNEVITETLIKEVYSIETRLLSFNGHKIICPFVEEKYEQ